MTCPRCNREVPTNEAACFKGCHEDCQVWADFRAGIIGNRTPQYGPPLPVESRAGELEREER